MSEELLEAIPLLAVLIGREIDNLMDESRQYVARAGIGWDQTPVTAQFRAVGLPDTDRYLIGFGLGYRLDDSNSIDGAHAHYFTSEQAHITGSANATDPVTHAVALDGKYNSGLDYLALSFRHRF